MGYELTSGQVAVALAADAVALSAATIQRYARSGRIPARQTPGGRYRYDLAEVRAALRTRPATETLSAATLTGGLGSGELGLDSAAERLRRAARGQRTNVKAVEDGAVASSGAPGAVRSQLAHAASRAIAFA
jgi:hypothetical protein